MPETIMLPPDLASFIKGASRAEIMKAENLLNALQNLKVELNINGGKKVVNATIQISGSSALLQIVV